MRATALFLPLATAAGSSFLFGQPGPGRARAEPPVVPVSVRPSGAGLGTIRLGAADEKIWFGWYVGIPSVVYRQLTFSEAAGKADALGLGSIEGFSNQKISPEIPKNLTYNLAPGERRAVKQRLAELNLKMPAYHVDSIGATDDSRRKLFEFAKSLGVLTIISGTIDGSALGDIERLANEFDVNVAFESRDDLRTLLAALEGRGKRLGVSANISAWADRGISPLDGLALVKDRLMAVTIGGRPNAFTGKAGSALADFFLAVFRLERKPLFIGLDSSATGDPTADLARVIAGFETAMRPAMTARVAQVVDSPQGKIRGPELLPPDMKRQIDDAIPRQALVKPSKPRKLLVVDLQMYSGHSTIPHANLMIELMGKYTAAFEPTFSNDLSNLKYPKIKQFDAVFLNSVCGMTFPDPEVRAGLLRFVREGGGIGGNHAVTFSNNDWPEFMEMLGAWAGAHHTETQVIKIDDTGSPLTAMFGGAGFEHTDEFYHFPPGSPYTREKQHILMSLDVDKSDMATQGKFCAACTRPDQDYGLSWIKSYGKGRVYCTPLGHTTILYTSKPWVEHLLAAIQFILGDLEADTTPSAKLAGRRQP